MFNWFTRQQRQKIDSLAALVAARSQSEAWEATAGTLKQLSEPAARGYIRGRAGIIVSRELFLATRSDQITAVQHQQIRESAVLQLVDAILAEHRQRQLTPQRRAA